MTEHIATNGNTTEVSKKSSRKRSSSSAISNRSEDDEIFKVFCETFEDGLALVDSQGCYVFVNEQYRKIHNGLEKFITKGACYNDVIKRGVENDTWDLCGSTKDAWLCENLFVDDRKRHERCLALSNGNWLLRRSSPHDSGIYVEICSDLTNWKNKEDDMHQALLRAEAAEQASQKALLREEARGLEEEYLSQLNHWLHSCKKLSELESVVESFMVRLLPDSHGALYVYNNSRDVLVPTCFWNTMGIESDIKADDCWGLRQGRAYHYGKDGLQFACKHTGEDFHREKTDEYYCIPILAHGDTAGMLHVRPSTQDLSDKHHGERAFKIACKCAEQISLAIANVKLSEELKDQSTRDPLTSLFNRRYFTERCTREISKATHSEISSSLLYLDVDYFKRYNDNFGHDAGDIVLKGFARLMCDHFRDSDVVCRIGGEEFAVLMPNVDKAVARKRAEELLPKVQTMKLRYGNETLPSITTSAGVVEIPTDGGCLEEIIKAADRALYDAKDAGRNQVV